MKKPEKKKCTHCGSVEFDLSFPDEAQCLKCDDRGYEPTVIIYNSCCDEWEKFLPSEEELISILTEWELYCLLQLDDHAVKQVASAISARLKGEK